MKKVKGYTESKTNKEIYRTMKEHRLIKFTIALTKFIIKGKGKFLPEEIILQRLEICKACSEFTGRSCKECGCNCGDKKKFMNKLAYPTEKCPLDKWLNTI